MEATIKTTNWNISTHALTEGDLAGNSSDDSRIFQLTPSRRATFSATGRRSSSIFQLTPSRRATRQHIFNMQRKEYFNSRPHGGRLYRIQFNQLPESISTHALTEGDAEMTVEIQKLQEFQLTPSRRATANLDKFFF